MIILGIDPGIANTGYGIIDEVKKSGSKNKFKYLGCGLIKTAPSSPIAERLQKLNNDLSKIIKVFQPDAVAIENVYFFRNLKTVIPVSQAQGVILLTAAKNKLPVSRFTPLQVKMTVTGFGRAEKKIVQQSVKKTLKLKELPKSDDAVDALAVALTYLIKKI
jgi:crossover junction endodeoxyribonuclease RuvC